MIYIGGARGEEMICKNYLCFFLLSLRVTVKNNIDADIK